MSSAYKTNVGVAWVNLDYFRLARLHFGYTYSISFPRSLRLEIYSAYPPLLSKLPYQKWIGREWSFSKICTNLSLKKFPPKIKFFSKNKNPCSIITVLWPDHVGLHPYRLPPIVIGRSINSQFFPATPKPLKECWGHTLQLFEIVSGLINLNINF
jgi:hypothetical protein